MTRSRAKVILRRAIVSSIFVVTLSAASCLGITSATNDVVAAIDSAISDLNANSAQFQDILSQLLDELPENTAASTRASIENVVGNATGLAQENFQCALDSVGIRARKLLERIRQEILHQEVGPMPPPLICQITPAVVDLKLDPDTWEEINITGYGFRDVDESGNHLDYKMVQTDGTLSSSLSSTGKIATSSYYRMTIDLSGETKVALLYDVNRLAAFWNNEMLPDQGEIIVQPWEASQRTRVMNLGTTSFVPPHTAGDKDFHTDDDEPTSLTVTAKLIVSPEQIVGEVYMHAREDGGDHTTVSGTTRQVLYTADDGYKILSVNPSGDTSIDRDITSHGMHRIARPGGEAANEVRVWVDRSGDEAGSYTRVEVEWKTVTILTEQTHPAW